MSSSDAVSTRPQACAKPELILPRSLCQAALPLLDAPTPDLSELRGAVLEHIEKTASLAREQPSRGVDLPLARHVGDRCLDLCDSIEEHYERDECVSAVHLALVVLAVRYFTTSDDLQSDSGFGGFGGFDDDALVVDAVASELGLEESGESW